MATDYNRDHVCDVDVRIGRSTFQQRNFLAPLSGAADIVAFDFALKALQNKQIPTALMTSAKDLDVCITDTVGERSDYTRDCHSLIAQHMNQALQRDDSLWRCESPDESVLLTPEEAIDSLAELYTRCVADGLVAHPRHWDGAKLMPDRWGTKVTLHPPTLSDRATYTEPIEFLFLPPWILRQHYALEDARRLVNEAIDRRCEQLRATMPERLGTNKFVGRRGCNRLDPLSRSTAPPRPKQPHFRGSAEAVKKAMEELRLRREFYNACLEEFRGPRKDVVFAPGTVMMRKLGAYCDPLPPSRIPFPPATLPRPPDMSD